MEEHGSGISKKPTKLQSNIKSLRHQETEMKRFNFCELNAALLLLSPSLRRLITCSTSPQMESESCCAAWMSTCLPSQIASSSLILAESSRCLCLHFIPSARVHLLCKYTQLWKQLHAGTRILRRAAANKDIRIIHRREWMLLVKPSNPTLADLIQSLTISSSF